MQFLIEVSTNQSSFLDSTALVIVGIVGFIAAVGIGSIALYNSKRPLDGRGEEQSDFLPKIDK